MSEDSLCEMEQTPIDDQTREYFTEGLPYTRFKVGNKTTKARCRKEVFQSLEYLQNKYWKGFMVYLEPIETNIITKKEDSLLTICFDAMYFFFNKIGIFISGSQVCVDDLENSRPLSLDMIEYPGTEMIFAFRDIKLI